MITNSRDVVEFPALAGRSVPNVEEVLQPVNLWRLADEPAGLELVAAFVAQAHAAVSALRQTGA